MIFGCLLPVFVLTGSFEASGADLATTWNSCNCRWANWEAWSDCNSDCFGERRRMRKVWLSGKPGCTNFADCATNDEGWDWGNCNEVCQNNGVPTGYSWIPCTCMTGYYSRCCTERVDCGTLNAIPNGSVSVTSTYYGDEARYSCNVDFNMTGGDAVRTCQNNFTWSGSQPQCLFVKHCNSSPCQNQATCVDLLDNFKCVCKEGWSGQLCDIDIQPPIVNGCRGNMDVNATNDTVSVAWDSPNFTDPMGSELHIVSNYPFPKYTFPWGDHSVQYTATKPSNGLVTECRFIIKVRPTPCKELNIPVNGAKLCNGWKTDYGHFCMVACHQNFTLSPEETFYTLYACGASGTWSISDSLPDCEVPVYSEDDGLFYHDGYLNFTYPSSCEETSTKIFLQDLYIERFRQTKGFNEFCNNFVTECIGNNVDVACYS